MRSFRERLQDILDAIAQIESERGKGKVVFNETPLIQVWMVHHLLIIGESVRTMDPAVKKKHPSIAWHQIAGMRNVLVHDYFRIDKEIVWQTVDKDIPVLKEQIEHILSSLPG